MTLIQNKVNRMKKIILEKVDEKLLFGKRLRERRISLDLSQEKVGVAIGLDESCSRTRISRYETGIHEPKLATAQLLANHLKTPLAYFYCEKDTTAKLLLKISAMSDEQAESLLIYVNSIIQD